MPLIVGIELRVELPSRHLNTSVSRGAYASILLRHINNRKRMGLQNSLEFFVIRRAIVYDYHLVISKRLSAYGIQSLTQVLRCVIYWNHHAYGGCFILRAVIRSIDSHLHRRLSATEVTV